MSYCTLLRLTVEFHHQFRPNIIIFHMVSQGQHWYIIIFYLAPDDASTIESIVMTIGEFPRRANLLVLRYFNADLVVHEVPTRDRRVATALASAGL